MKWKELNKNYKALYLILKEMQPDKEYTISEIMRICQPAYCSTVAMLKQLEAQNLVSEKGDNKHKTFKITPTGIEVRNYLLKIGSKLTIVSAIKGAL